jgi:hypothetical protein
MAALLNRMPYRMKFVNTASSAARLKAVMVQPFALGLPLIRSAFIFVLFKITLQKYNFS